MYPRLETKWANPVNENVLRAVSQESQESFVTINDPDSIGDMLVSANAVLDKMLIAANGANYSLVTVTFPVLGWAENWTKFHELATKWKQDRSGISSRIQNIVSDPNYLQIIGMGPDVVPLILLQLRNELKYSEPDHWFVALRSITGENPVPAASRGNLVEMAKSWIEWGVERGLLDAENFRGAFSKSW